MGTCTSIRNSGMRSTRQSESQYGKYSKIKDIDAFSKKLRKKDFNNVVDKIYNKYDLNHDGNLDIEEIKKFLGDALIRKNIKDDDVQAVLRLSKSHSDSLSKQ